MNAISGPARYRTIWISDVHLGTRGCRAELLLEFLRHTESEHLYLVGDIVDGWRLRKGYWPQAHNDVLQKLLGKARRGTRVVYLPGNHDEFARHHLDNRFGRIRVVHEAVHETADGRRLLVLHGDGFDGVVRYARGLAPLGNHAQALAMALNRGVNGLRRRFGLPYWSVSAYVKHKVKDAVRYVARFEQAMAGEARRRGLDGIVCGHIHRAALRQVDGVLYCNDGDWVDSCTALVEHADGRLEILFWADAIPGLSTGHWRQAAGRGMVAADRL